MNQRLKCDRCLWEWEYKGEKKSTKDIPLYVSCPRCRKNLKLPLKVKDE